MADSRMRVDRSAMVERMNDMLKLDPARTAVITIDMQ